MAEYVQSNIQYVKPGDFIPRLNLFTVGIHGFNLKNDRKTKLFIENLLRHPGRYQTITYQDGEMPIENEILFKKKGEEKHGSESDCID